MYPNYNPYSYSAPQQYKITHIRGEEGANTIPMQPNSEALLLDDTAPIVWLVQVDGMGYRSVTPYDICQHVSVPEPNINDLIERIDRLEKTINEYELKQSNSTEVAKQYGKSDGESNKQQSAVSTGNKVRQ